MNRTRRAPATTGEMWAVQYHRHGGPEVLAVENVPSERPTSRQVLVHTRVSGLSRVDAVFRRGQLPHGVGFPKRTGFDAIGEVVHSQHRDLPVGSWVAIVLGLDPLRTRGTTVQLLAVEPERCGVFPRGYEPSVDDGAAVLGGLTALRAMRNGVRVRPRDRVLVVGAGGPVGLAAIQLATLHGATVDAVAGAAALPSCRDVGAAEAYDYRGSETSELRTGRRYDAVVIAAGKPAEWCLAARTGGRIALTDASTWPASICAARAAGVRLAPIAAGHDATELSWIAHRIASGDLRGVVGRRYAVPEIVRAHAELGAGSTRGARLIDHGDLG